VAVSLAPGVEWLCMPLPFALNHINLWLLADGEGYAASIPVSPRTRSRTPGSRRWRDGD
jgi:hypothetical protein